MHLVATDSWCGFRFVISTLL